MKRREAAAVYYGSFEGAKRYWWTRVHEGPSWAFQNVLSPKGSFGILVRGTFFKRAPGTTLGADLAGRKNMFYSSFRR